MTREQELQLSLKEILTLVETNQLVRNPLADDQPDWMKKMIRFVDILKRATDLVAEPPSKEPAVAKPYIVNPPYTSVPGLYPIYGEMYPFAAQTTSEPVQDWSQCCCVCRPEDTFGHYCNDHVYFSQPSEQLQADLEPITNQGKKFCV